MFPESVLKRIRPFLYESDECIDFPLLSDQGYGRITCRIDNKTRYLKVHRIVYSYLNNTELASSDVIMHTCDRPSCCNPKHLKKGTHKENMDDRDAKGRVASGVRAGSYKHGLRTKEKIAEAKLKLLERGTNAHCKLSLREVTFAKIMIAEGETLLSNIARILNVPHHVILDLKAGRNYKHVSITQ